jgi:hypothetical protein
MNLDPSNALTARLNAFAASSGCRAFQYLCVGCFTASCMVARLLCTCRRELVPLEPQGICFLLSFLHVQWAARFPLKEGHFPPLQLSDEDKEKLLVAGKGLVPTLMKMTESEHVRALLTWRPTTCCSHHQCLHAVMSCVDCFKLFAMCSSCHPELRCCDRAGRSPRSRTAFGSINRRRVQAVMASICSGQSPPRPSTSTSTQGLQIALSWTLQKSTGRCSGSSTRPSLMDRCAFNVFAGLTYVSLFLCDDLCLHVYMDVCVCVRVHVCM